jgi:hypothetical protein
MPKTTLKFILWLFLSAVAISLAWVATSGVASIIAYFQQGADPAAALNILPNLPPDLHVAIEWLPDDPQSGRPLDSFTRQQIELAYQWAWVQWNISYLRGEPYGLETYFTTPALNFVRKSVMDAAVDKLQIQQINTAHRLKLNLYSADGNLIAFTDQAAQISSIIQDSSNAVIFSGETRAAYEVVMLQQEGRWQIRDWVRTQTILMDDAAAPSATSQPEYVPGQGTIAGINYYPQATPWDKFWSNYNPAVIAMDFARIRLLGLNTIRIFVGFEAFGGPNVDPDMLDRLQDLLDQAQEQNLKVIVTLFDFRTNYDPLLWPQSDRHLEQLIPPFSNHPAVLAWDIKNQPDLDFRTTNPVVVKAWLAHTARHLHQLAPNQIVTIGWSSAEAAESLIDAVDMVTFHDYRPPEGFPERLKTLRRAVGSDKPIMLGEFGLPSWNSIFPNGHTEAEQAEYYAKMLRAVRESNLAGSVAWTLYDFTSIPASVAGRLPWQSGPEANLGIVRANGSLKPSAYLLNPNASLDITPLPAYARFLKPFWLLVGAFGITLLSIISFLVGRWILRRRKRRTR